MSKIKFGTDGWRGIIARDFTFDNVRLVSQAVADYVNSLGIAERGLVIGYDNRFLSDKFAEAAAETMAENGIPVYMTETFTPTPLTAFAIKECRTAGAVMLTASHNPPEYNGIKFIPEYAGPALPYITEKIEKNIRSLETSEKMNPENKSRAEIKKINPFPAYKKHLAEIIDFDIIRRAGLKVVVDPMFGCGIGYLEAILHEAGVHLEVIHNNRDPLFGGGMPEPSQKLLVEMKDRVLAGKANLGLALDGDADRFGIIDSNGEFITPNMFLPILYYHLLAVRQWRGPVARTVATTHLLDHMARHYNLEVEETSVGFKYIGQCLMEKDAVLGGEESGGLSIKGHIPEKDGILATMLAAEIVAHNGLSLTQMMEKITDLFGKLYSERLDIKTSPAEKERIMDMLGKLAPDSLAGQKITGRVTVDGLKLVLESGAWVLIRPSGTEPLFRVYVEANSIEEMRKLQAEIKGVLGLD
jgi:alpha-D-glucose phosphate-specific phosphoglucomutase